MAQEIDQQALLVRAGRRIWEMAEADPQLGALKPKPEVAERLQEPELSYREVVAAALAGYAERPALGSRDYEIATDSETGDRVRRYLPAYRTLGYGELARQVEAVANFWRYSADHRVGPGEFVAFMAFSGAEMIAADLACAYANAVAVPLQANMPSKDMAEILADTAPVSLVASVDNLTLAIEAALSQESVRSILVIDADLEVDAERRAIEAARASLAEAGGTIMLATFAEAVSEGGRHRFEPLPPPEGGRDSLSLVMYTSGSTGTPKGAMIHQAICIAAWTAPRGGAPTIGFIYAPMNHFMGRNALHSTLAQGGTAYLTLRSDLSTLIEDVRLARPTFFTFIPRIAELVHQHYLTEVQRRITDGAERGEAGRAVREEMRSTFLGDRLNTSTVSSAPVSPELRRFLAECFDIPVMIGYGSTESGGGGITRNDWVLPTVLDHKLIDVPELGYYTTDKPYPRGELLVKTAHMMRGYFKRPDATAAIFDGDGFLRTGDIMEQRAPGRLVWLDRRNNVMKLAQGEYVAIGPLETVFLGHGRLIRQIYLYGSAQRAFLLAVVVPDIDIARERLGHEPSDAELRRIILDDMRGAAVQAELKSFEVPRDILIEREPFSQAGGLLSSVGKPLRPRLRERYGDALEAMYQEIERQQAHALELLRSGGETASTIERVAGALRIGLGLAVLEATDPRSYAELGGDSLGAVTMALLLEEMFGIALPVSAILHPGASAARIAARIDDLLAGSQSVALYETVHPDPERISASELRLDALLNEEILATARVAAPAVSEVRTVLLTGANGFLGRFLCLEWLEQLAPVGGKLICLVRGNDAAGARERLEEAFGTLDRALTERFRALSGHLEVLAADLAMPQLGLDDASFSRLADEVDRIVHPAAMVNHRFSYRNLFESNVVGTAELVRLALTDRLKGFDYVSSIAVVHMNPELAGADEDADVRERAAAIGIAGDHYALGYGASKWAGEVLLREANEQFGLPVNVFRADMILPHARYRGQINVPDMFTRLLASIVMTGLAPKSFYELGAGGERQSAHYDGLPVDFVAAAMRQIGARGDEAFRTYNVVNMHDDGISLDTMIDWMIDAGYDLTRVEDYGEWLRRFEERLRNLPDEQRQHSCLNIMGRLLRPSPAHPPQTRCAAFRAAVREIAAGPDVPHLGEDYIGKCLKDMQLLDVIRQPALAGN